MSPTVSDFEKEIIEHFEKQLVTNLTSDYLDQLYDLMVKHKWGENARDPMNAVDWKMVFDQNVCPACNKIISLKDTNYSCSDCGFTIPFELYDAAKKEYEDRKKFLEDDKSIRKRIITEGMTSKDMERLYDMAYRKALAKADKIDTEKLKKEALKKDLEENGGGDEGED